MEPIHSLRRVTLVVRNAAAILRPSRSNSDALGPDANRYCVFSLVPLLLWNGMFLESREPKPNFQVNL